MIQFYDYQEQGIEAMLGAPGFLLADDMGLGKTYQAIGELHKREGEWSNVLIVCPNSAKSVWVDALNEFWDEHNGFEVRLLDGRTKEQIAAYRGPGFIIVNWDAVRVIPGLQLVKWDYIIADEAHAMKNRTAKRTRALKRIKTAHKRALTGTPMVNRPDELWSILNWLNPGAYRSYWRFFEKYIDYWQHPLYGYKEVRGPKNVEALKEELQGIMLRRTKREVLKELPDKYYTKVRVDLTPKQRRAYNQMKRDSLAWVEQLPEEQPLKAPTILAQLTRLRQFASAYCEIQDDGSVRMSEPSAKIDALMEIIHDTDEPIVIFSQFRQMIGLVLDRLMAGPDVGGWTTLTGETPERARGGVIESFQEGRARLFLATIQAGGVGITLHKASTAVFLDRTWSPAMNLQAEDRLHRIGQKNAVQIIHIEASQTVDSRVETSLSLKRKWFRDIIGE